LAFAGVGIGKPANLQKMGDMIAGFIILYPAMRRSIVFVKPLLSI
jgi:hypothetical protein